MKGKALGVLGLGLFLLFLHGAKGGGSRGAVVDGEPKPLPTTPSGSDVGKATPLPRPARSSASPLTDAVVARADIEKVPTEAQPYQRYLARGYLPEKDLEIFDKLLAVHVNKLSREADLVAPVLVAPNLYRLDVRNYGKVFARIYEKLAEVDPYYHTNVDPKETEEAPGAGKAKESGKTASKEPVYETDENGKRWTYKNPRTGEYEPKVIGHKEVKTGKAKDAKKAKQVKVSLAPWLLSPKEQQDLLAGICKEKDTSIGRLVYLTQSQAPLLRADWFFAQSAIQAGRKGTGYYDFLGLKKRDDYFVLIGLDVKLAQRQKREVASILRRSGISENNRQVFRFGAVDAGAWQTRDVFDTSTGKKNALRNLDEDYDHDAEEWYGFLPNRLLAYYLADKKGVQQDSAPDKVGPDTTSTSNRGRIDVMLSCARCHVEGIRPIDDWGRRFWRPPLALQATEYDRFLRLKQLYLGNLKRFVKRDQDDYTETIRDFVQLKPSEVALAYKRAWKWYTDDDVTLSQAALELGVNEKHLLAALHFVLKSTGSIDPVLGGLIHTPPEGILRDQWEEAYPLAQSYIRGYVPPP